MPSMSAAVARGWYLERLDDYFNSGQADYARLLKCIKKHKSYTKILSCAGIMNPKDPVDAAMMKHLNDHWLATQTTKAYWPHIPHKEDIVILGLKQIAEMHQAEPHLKVTVLWVCSGGLFQTNTVRTDTSIVTLILTPPVPAGAVQLPETQRDDIHVIAEHQQIQAIVANATMWKGRPKARDIVKYVDKLPTKTSPGKRIWGVEVFTAPHKQ